jgi:hypothetical protein
MGTCCHHDWVDYLAALGPTIATIAAGTATVLVYLRGEKFQKKLVRPLIVVGHKLSVSPPLWHWIVEIRNEGQGAANIESCVIVAANEIVTWESPQPASDFWAGVLLRLGALRVQQVKGHIILTPFAIGARETHLLFDAHVAGQVEQADAIMRKLEIRGKYTSSFGERKSFRMRFGRDDRTHED